MHPSFRVLALAVLAFLLPAPYPASAAVPNAIEYQGRVAVGGVPFNGTGLFRFALVDPNGPRPLVELGPVAGGSDPIPLPVERGLYRIRLGVDTAALPDGYFDSAVIPRLRVWFNDGAHGEQQLTPDLTLASVPYALSSRFAEVAALASRASHANQAAGLSSTLPATQVSGTFASTQIPAQLPGTRSFEGPVGIGTDTPSPSVALDVWGDVTVTPTALAGGVSLVSPDPTAAVGYYLRDAGGERAALGLAKNVGDYSADALPGDVVLRTTGNPAGKLILQNDAGEAAMTIAENRVGIAAAPDRSARLKVGGDLVVDGEISAFALRAEGGLSWVSVTDGEVNAAVNQGYRVLGNDGFTRFTLPSTAAVGDVIRIVGVGSGRWNVWTSEGKPLIAPAGGRRWTPRGGNGNWTSIACSADGVRVVACDGGGSIYTSADAGASWIPRVSGSSWTSVASSADGQRLVACASIGRIWTSSDAGETWHPHAESAAWSSVASSADGSHLVACVEGAEIFTSADGGESWTPRESKRTWKGVASSADGTRLIACAEPVFNGIPNVDTLEVVVPGGVFVSSDSGLRWTSAMPLQNPVQRFWAVASSADGGTLLAGSIEPPYRNAYLNGVRISHDAGQSWGLTLFGMNWTSLGTSADGTRLIACADEGVFTSEDAGGSWHQRLAEPFAWSSVASSADGSRLFACGSNNGQIYVSSNAADGSAGDTVELHYSASGEWILSRLARLQADGQLDPYQLPYQVPGDRWFDGPVGVGVAPDFAYSLRVGGDLGVDGTIYGTVSSPSDARLKTDVLPVSDSLSLLERLRGVTFCWRSVPGRPAPSPGRQVGVVAQDVAAVLPELVQTNADGYLSVNYSGLTPVLVEAVKELKRECDTQQRTLEGLTAGREAERALVSDLARRLDRLEGK